MIAEVFDISPPEIPQAKLERAFIEEFLAGKGYSLKALHLHSDREAVKTLMTEACTYASTRLAQIETRSILVEKLHKG